MKYLNDSYTFTFQGHVIDVVTYDQRKAIILEDTYFYPEGGGQPSDRGSIGPAIIEEVQLVNGLVYHICSNSDLNDLIGQNIPCKIDGQRRLSLMQQHTGQHLLSACAYKYLQAQTVGFHIGEDYVTIDLDKKFKSDEIEWLEMKVNQAIFSNLPLKVHYPDASKLMEMPLRKMPKVSENIRVIEIEGMDFSPCGGTHLKRTGEIGLMKIKKFESYKKGVRIEFVCGSYALNVFKRQTDLINQLMQLYSSKETEIVDFALNTFNQVKELKKAVTHLTQLNIEKDVSLILKDYEEVEAVKIIHLNERDMRMNLLQEKVHLLVQGLNTIVLASSIDGEKQHIVMAKSRDLGESILMNELFKHHFSVVGIKGGGNNYTAQGGTLASVQVTQIFLEIESEIKTVIT